MKLHKTPLDLATEYRVKTLPKFDTALIDLIIQADEFNRGKLLVSYPDHYDAFLIYFHELDQNIEDLKNRRISS